MNNRHYSHKLKQYDKAARLERKSDSADEHHQKPQDTSDKDSFGMFLYKLDPFIHQ